MGTRSRRGCGSKASRTSPKALSTRARQVRAETPGRRGEGPFRKGTATQGLLAQRSGSAVPRRVLEELELPHRTAREASRRRQVVMAAKWIELVTGSLEQKRQYRQCRARMDALPEPYVTAAKALHRYFMYNVGTPSDESALTMFGD